MADKPRTPPPPRKVQAPRVRHRQPSRPGGGIGMPSTNVVIGVALALLVGLVVGLVVVLTGGGASASNVGPAETAKVAAAMRAAGCSFSTSPAASGGHMTSPDQKVTYDTFPPSSGVHDGSATTIWGNYAIPVDPRQSVHNLEHGGVVVWYGPRISAEDRARLDAFYDDSPNGIVVTPVPDPFPGVTYPKREPLGSKVALTAWTADVGETISNGRGVVSICPRVDRDAFSAFRDTYRGKGPERFPVSALKRGGT